jgi:hypothetical protein
MKKTILALALMAGLTSFAGNAKASLVYNFGFKQGAIDLSGQLVLSSAVASALEQYAASPVGENGFLGYVGNGTSLTYTITGNPLVNGTYTTTPGSGTGYNYGAEFVFQSATSFNPLGTLINQKDGISVLTDFKISDAINGNFDWDHRTLGVGANKGTEGQFNFVNANLEPYYLSAVQDTAVPEPSTYALFGIGAIGMLMVLRRKKAA